MTNVYLWNCAEAMPEIRGQLFNQRMMGGRASYFVGQYSSEVLKTIKDAKKAGLEGPTVQEVLERNSDKLSTIRQFKHANPRAKPQEAQQSVAATMQQLVQNGDLTKVSATTEDVSTEPLAARSTSSRLWGVMQPIPTRSLLDPATAQMALISIMPLQNHVSASSPLPQPQGPIANTPTNTLQSPPTNGELRIVEEPDIDVPFTLNDRKKKRAAD